MPDPTSSGNDTGAPVTRVRGSRRVIRAGAAGADPTPQATSEVVRAAEDIDASWSAGTTTDNNDAQLKQDVPPHWG